MIWLCVYLWACSTGACLFGIKVARGWVCRADIPRCVLFPVLFPFFLITTIIKGIR